MVGHFGVCLLLSTLLALVFLQVGQPVKVSTFVQSERSSLFLAASRSPRDICC